MNGPTRFVSAVVVAVCTLARGTGGAQAYPPVLCGDGQGAETPPVRASVGNLNFYAQVEYTTFLQNGDIVTGNRVCVYVTDLSGAEVVGIDLGYGLWNNTDPQPASVGRTLRLHICGIGSEFNCSEVVHETGVEAGTVGGGPAGLTGVSVNDTCVYVNGVMYGPCPTSTLVGAGINLGDLPTNDSSSACLIGIGPPGTCQLPYLYVTAGQAAGDTVVIVVGGTPVRVNMPPVCEPNGLPEC